MATPATTTATPDRTAGSSERGQRRLQYLFTPMKDADKCLRCKENVYQYEKVGPVNNSIFHTFCFKCCICGQHLNLKNFCTNQTDPSDHEIYCSNHCPRIGAARMDNKAMAIHNAVSAQNVYRKAQENYSGHDKPHFNAEAMAITRAMNAPKTSYAAGPAGEAAHIDANALHIAGALNAQRIQKHYAKKTTSRHHYPAHLVKKRQAVFVAQEKLEHVLRKEEDELYKEFQKERKEVSTQVKEEIEQEWESRLKDMTEQFDRQMNKKGKKLKEGEKKAMTMQFENQKNDLETSMTHKREKKKKNLTLKLIAKEQRATSSLVKKQSEQMLQMLADTKKQLQQELEGELLENGHHGLHNGDDSLDSQDSNSPPESPSTTKEQKIQNIADVLDVFIPVPSSEIPAPHPPTSRKRDLYEDASIFHDIDEEVYKIAENEQGTYTDLVRQLTETLISDLDKARAIYRWITVKDLNVMEFDDTVDADTPMGLLRGIKYGTETYHTLFMRLCSYAGLPCVEIRGHSKSVGYEPGMKIQPDTFQNTWNAVLVDKNWRMVQCNWGARHLVLNKDKNPEKKKKDQIRYQYDEHYFLTDPDEFIQEFWPYEPDWQLLEQPITLDDFERLPFVRSIFFHYCMRFEGSKFATLDTTDKGGADITIRVPEDLEDKLVFYYQLRFAEKEKMHETTYKGACLERFVYQTMVDNSVMFSVHVPTTGDYFFEIFANKFEEDKTAESGTMLAPFRLKCACKFKISCTSLTGKMHPLPNCASGEWGPKKALRHFHIDPHLDTESTFLDKNENLTAGIVNADDDFELKFHVNRPLQFVAKLRMNQVDDHILDPFVKLSVKNDILTVYVKMPQPGQYGLDLYARAKEAKESHTLSHACKYLVNCSKVASPVDIPRNNSIMPTMSKDKWGPSPLFAQLGLTVITHKDPTIQVADSSHLTIEVGGPSDVIMSYQFIREPDEDDREYVSMVRESSGKAKFFINMPKVGNYMLAIYARQESDDSKSMSNVYNYLIQYNTVPTTHYSIQVIQYNTPNGSLENGNKVNGKDSQTRSFTGSLFKRSLKKK